MRLSLFVNLMMIFILSSGKDPVEDKVVCPSKIPALPDPARSDVYKDMPFQPGEKLLYDVKYMGILAGKGFLEVKPPQKYQNRWHRIFRGEAHTGEWYEKIFVVHEIVESISRPWDFGVSKFYLQQFEGKLFSKAFEQKKWLDFDQEHCKVKEKIVKADKNPNYEEHDLAYGAIDALAVAYYLRTLNFTLGKKERTLVYTSEKNWWLEADPLAFEKIKVAAGTFDTVKLKLQTYLGKDLQQKGDVYVWIGREGNRPLVQIQGDVKIGSLWMILTDNQVPPKS